MPSPFTFEISLTVLNHLGRQLYRNFITILGEAISNAWDADATNVWIVIDRENSTMSIVDDGIGMTPRELQNRFLKIGYTKRGIKGKNTKSFKGRPYIGAKGIGKLALLSCAKRVSIMSRKQNFEREPAGCLIDNQQLDEAIQQDQTAGSFPLPSPDSRASQNLINHNITHGTSLFFDNLKPLNNRDGFLRRALAMSFRFTLVDQSFTIHYNGTPVTIGELRTLAEHTQFVWTTPKFEDEFLNLKPPLEHRDIEFGLNAKGFIATADKPTSLAIYGKSERVGIDLFVNGRLRERDLIKHFPTSQHAAQYIYGQIHLNNLDEPGRDPFTSSREGIIEGDPIFNEFLEQLKKVTQKIIGQWDELRDKYGEEGDLENPRKSPQQRAADSLIGKSLKEFEPKNASLKVKKLLESAQSGLPEAVQDYSRIYILENFMRELLIANKIISENDLPLKKRKRIEKYYENAHKDAESADLALVVRRHDAPLWYLGLGDLLDLSNNAINNNQGKMLTKRLESDKATLSLLRNIVMHTADLTNEGRLALNFAVQNLVAKIKKTLDEMDDNNSNN